MEATGLIVFQNMYLTINWNKLLHWQSRYDEAVKTATPTTIDASKADWVQIIAICDMFIITLDCKNDDVACVRVMTSSI